MKTQAEIEAEAAEITRKTLARVPHPHIIPSGDVAKISIDQWKDLGRHSNDHGSRIDCPDCDRFQRAYAVYPTGGDEAARVILFEIFNEPKTKNGA